MAVVKKKPKRRNWLPWAASFAFLAIALIVFSLPSLFLLKQEYTVSQEVQPFPVSVYPAEKKIVDNPAVDAMFANQNSGLSAAVANAGDFLDELAVAIGSSPWYEALAASDLRFITIEPGYRKEQIAAAFGKALGWSSATQKTFLAEATTTPGLPDGTFSPDTYAVGLGTTPQEALSLTNEKFSQSILARYATSTQAIVPLSQALTIASMIERETSDPAEMRLISGIIWNRIFDGMNLQIDATVQYAKGTSKNWWPQLTSKDKYIKSPYNTYQNVGLPPAPISNPGVAAVIAALNPVPTQCLFYFHDSSGGFHCSATYAAHVALLKQYYGRGK
jgi:UPF0755 protein